MNKLPLSIREVKPAPLATRLNGTRYDGLPDGVHTGGAWLYEGLVYKPLDGRPFANCTYHYSTQEDECLELMSGRPGFPRNWHVEERNGRRWLVRKKAFVVTKPRILQLDELLFVERAVRDLNQHKWEVGDSISLAYDADTYELFILDLSCAHPQEGTGAFAADENWRVLKLFKEAGYERLAAMRERGQHIFHDPLHFEALFDRDVRDYHFLYGSFNRPLSTIWATLPEDVLLLAAARWYAQTYDLETKDGIPHTWVISPAELDADLIYRYELTLCWEEA